MVSHAASADRGRAPAHEARAIGLARIAPTIAARVRRRQLRLQRTIILILLSLLFVNVGIVAWVVGPGVLTLTVLGPSLLGFVGGLAALGLSVRRRFVGAGVLALLAFLGADLWQYVRGAPDHNPLSLLMFIVPMILAGILFRRWLLYATAAAVVGGVLAVHVTEAFHGIPFTVGILNGQILFGVIVALLALFFDRFGSALVDALREQAALADENARLYLEAQHANALLEERVRERTDDLERANDELEAFAYSVSHDLRSPLRAVDGFSEALLEEHGAALDPEGRFLLQRVRANTLRMRQLIDDLLSLSRASRSELALGRVRVGELARSILEDLRAGDRGRRVTATIEDDLEGWGDEPLVRIVLENLLGNAWKFTEKRERAHVTVGRDPATDAFFVRDDGVGFDADRADELFQPFRRLHSEQEYHGSGVGLATVHRIVSRHGGRVWAEAVAGEGATFYFTLPSAPGRRVPLVGEPVGSEGAEGPGDGGSGTPDDGAPGTARSGSGTALPDLPAAGSKPTGSEFAPN